MTEITVPVDVLGKAEYRFAGSYGKIKILPRAVRIDQRIARFGKRGGRLQRAGGFIQPYNIRFFIGIGIAERKQIL